MCIVPAVIAIGKHSEKASRTSQGTAEVNWLLEDVALQKRVFFWPKIRSYTSPVCVTPR